MSLPFSSSSSTATTSRPPPPSHHISSFSFECIQSTTSSTANNSRSNSINSLLYLNSSNSSMGSNLSDSSASIAATATSNSTPANNLHHLHLIAMPSAQQQEKDDVLHEPDHSQPNHTPTLLSTASYTLQRPPGLQHDYQSSISSISSTSSNSTSSSISPGLINYSPKHSRKPSSLTMNRNMKNLSLNLQESTNGYTKTLPKLASTSTSSLVSNRSKIPNIDSPIKKNVPLLSQNYYNLDSTALQTPTITETPKMPPSLQQQDPLSAGSLYKFPPIINNHNINHSNNSSTIGFHNGATDSDSDAGSVSMKRIAKNNIIPPAPPPFALQSKSSPLSTPPRLQSPLGGLDNSSKVVTASPTQSIDQRFNGISINSPAEAMFQTHSNNNSTTLLSTPQNLVYNSKKFNVPEELQELTSINAYPNGPRSVLDNLIYLYSDPIEGNLDVSQFDLVINVAKECKNLTRSYGKQVPEQREYHYIPWSHNSSISKDLFDITTTIEQFYNKGLKILVHCQCGVSRSACVVVAFFMKKFQLGVNEAYELLKNGNDELNIEACDRICPNMSLIFELMEFGDRLNNNEISTQQLLMNSPPTINI
ncbi:Dual specificity protein tyrosine phosphatase CCP1 [Candida viswanathii]|uniref:protein-tyrosine-phosphatase n=1 Tax=Candida viswanathii TaxID=5486 RepID=A0A367YEC4_9ASCO|nr:Dual specificity protein tyrosine phosphatase CCP1 [Candida viswanathii]